jgi:DGQHR domain-containing protein
VLTVECLLNPIVSGGTSYPVYVGFLPAVDIARVAEAPSFLRTTPHQQIATNIASQPVRDWQRPIDPDRVTTIADTFDNTGRLMPNPVLLAQNAFTAGVIQIVPKTIPNSPQLTGSYVVTIDDTAQQSGQKPLWILDGQHRIAGLSQSHQRNNPVPVVFLLDGGAGAYSSPLLASLFAQVTTSATKLDDLHNEWLTFAFELDEYAPSRPQAAVARRSFEAVAALCRTPAYQGQANPFGNQVQFNEHLAVSPAHGGFSYKCTALKQLLYRNYFNQPAAAGHLNPDELAEQLALSYSALHSVVGSQPDSVFFGTTAKQQTIMQDAFLIGVCARLLKHGPPPDWANILKTLRFHQTNWDFSWTRAMSGPANTVSKRIAIRVLSGAIAEGSLPEGSGSLADYLKGNGATVRIALSALTANDRPKRQGRIELEVVRGGNTSQAVHEHRHVKVIDQSSNIGKLEVVDASVRGQPLQYREITGRGLVLTPELPNPLKLMFLMSHYGDQHHHAELEISWVDA